VHGGEVKYRVRDLGALLAALEMRGVELGVPFCQDDQAYAPDGWAYGDDRRGVPFARLRTFPAAPTRSPAPASSPSGCSGRAR